MGISTHMGGAEQSLLDFLKKYKQESSTFQVLLPKSKGPLIEELKKNNISITTMPMPKLFLSISKKHFLWAGLLFLIQLPIFALYILRLRNFIVKNKFNTIHSTGIKCHIILCLLSTSLKTKIIIHFRDIISSKILKIFFNLYRDRKNIKWVSNSKSTAASLDKIKSQVIYNGFCVDKFSPNKSNTLKQQLSLSPGTKLIGILGVLSPWKGQVEFIKAAKRVLHEFPHGHFIIAGDQIYDTRADRDYLIKLQTLVKDLNIEDHIHFTGFVDSPQNFLNNIDILVHASIRPEPFGRVVVEAMLCKTPVIASRAGGVLEVIEENSRGLLHTPGDVNELSEKMLFALDNDKVLEMTETAYDFARRNYSLEKNVLELKRIL